MSEDDASRSDAPGRAPLQVEAALNAVRVVLCVVAGFVLIGYRPLVAPVSWTRVALELGALAAGAAALTWIGSRIAAGRATSPAWIVGLQGLEVAGTLGVIVVLDAPLGDVAWALIVVPIVGASVRLGAAAALLAWAAGCAGYYALTLAGAIVAGPRITELQRAGMLLAVAASVGILARWLREGWIAQAQLSAVAAERGRLLSVIQRAAREMTGRAGTDLLRACATHALDLGFAAVTVSEPGSLTVRMAVGDGSVVPGCERLDTPPPGQVIVTSWVADRSERVVSASVLEPTSLQVVSGWQRGPITADRAESLGELVRHAGVAGEIGGLLARLRREATRDPLTKLPNRREFDRRLAAAAAGRGPIAVLLLDLDNFKAVNDRLGHAGGDRLLAAIAGRLAGLCRSGGVPARLGGDEFVVLLRGHEVARAPALAKAILAAVAQPIPVAGHRLAASVSIGAAVANAPVDGGELLRAADEAAYGAKAAGRGTFKAVHLAPAPRPATRPLERGEDTRLKGRPGLPTILSPSSKDAPN